VKGAFDERDLEKQGLGQRVFLYPWTASGWAVRSLSPRFRRRAVGGPRAATGDLPNGRRCDRRLGIDPRHDPRIRGRRRWRYFRCATCHGFVQEADETCGSCGERIIGEIAHARDRLDREEELEEQERTADEAARPNAHRPPSGRHEPVAPSPTALHLRRQRPDVTARGSVLWLRHETPRARRARRRLRGLRDHRSQGHRGRGSDARVRSRQRAPRLDHHDGLAGRCVRSAGRAVLQHQLRLRGLRQLLGRHVRPLQHQLGLQRSRQLLGRHVQPLQHQLGLQDRHVLERQVRWLQHQFRLQGQRDVLEQHLWSLQHQLRLQRGQLLERHVRSLQLQLGLQRRHVLEQRV
jgi:hypothetical protein